MARRREAALKRAREKARKEKQELKRERREARETDPEPGEAVDEQALLEEFARLSERHESNQIPTVEFEERRHAILVKLGIEPDV